MLNVLNNINILYFITYNIITFLTLLIYIFFNNNNNASKKISFLKNHNSFFIWTSIWIVSSLPVTSLFLLKLVIVLKDNSNIQIILNFILVFTTTFLIMYFFFTQVLVLDNYKKNNVFTYNEYNELYLIISFFIIIFLYPYIIFMLI